MVPESGESARLPKIGCGGGGGRKSSRSEPGDMGSRKVRVSMREGELPPVFFQVVAVESAGAAAFWRVL